MWVVPRSSPPRLAPTISSSIREQSYPKQGQCRFRALNCLCSAPVMTPAVQSSRGCALQETLQAAHIQGLVHQLHRPNGEWSRPSTARWAREECPGSIGCLTVLPALPAQYGEGEGLEGEVFDLKGTLLDPESEENSLRYGHLRVDVPSVSELDEEELEEEEEEEPSVGYYIQVGCCQAKVAVGREEEALQRRAGSCAPAINDGPCTALLLLTQEECSLPMRGLCHAG